MKRRRSLREELYERPGGFQFFQAVRLLRLLKPGRAGVGHDRDPHQEVVRFRSDLSYAFPVGDIRSIEEPAPPDTELELATPAGAGQEGAGAMPAMRLPPPPVEPDRMVVNFLGIATPASFGSLPTPYVEEIRHQERSKNYAMRDFLDLFNHRLVSFFYRAWERSRAEVLYEAGNSSPYEAALRALAGMEGEAHTGRLPFDSRHMLSRVGLLAMHPASTSALTSLVESLFGIPAQIEQFLPCWYEMDDADRTRLGRANTVLGEDATLGAQTCLSQWRFRIRLGPMNLETYERLLPEGSAFNTLAAAVRMATGPEYDFEFTLVLDREAVPRLRLGETHEGPTCRLGWTTWLGEETPDTDADHAVFTPSLAQEEARDSLEMRA